MEVETDVAKLTERIDDWMDRAMAYSAADEIVRKALGVAETKQVESRHDFAFTESRSAVMPEAKGISRCRFIIARIGPNGRILMSGADIPAIAAR